MMLPRYFFIPSCRFAYELYDSLFNSYFCLFPFWILLLALLTLLLLHDRTSTFVTGSLVSAIKTLISCDSLL